MGFVSMKIRQRFSKISGDKAAQFVKCLDRMRHDGDEGSTTSFMDYTREWVHKVNRGGLFLVCNDTYKFFVSLELATRNELPDHLSKTAVSSTSPITEEGVSALVQSICSNEDVLFRWTFVGVEDEDMSRELLEHIVKLWITVQGFSLSKAWMEDYKGAIATTQKKKSLRRQLKQTK